MKEILNLLIDLFTSFHKFFVQVSDKQNLHLSDKELHFYVIGILCLAIFIFIQFIFKRLSKWKISSISFIYTLTVAIVITFAIEIGQWKANTGNVEFADIVFGIYGFIVIFFLYQLTLFLFRIIYKNIVKHSKGD